MILTVHRFELHGRKFQTLVVFTGCLIAIATQGCIPAPQTAKHAGAIPIASSTTASAITRPAATGPAAMGPATTAPMLSQLWKTENIRPKSPSPIASAAVKRIAITEFAVEFVTVRTRTPFDSQLAVKIPPWNPIGAALELIGISRAETPFPPESRIALTAKLYDQFRTHLDQLGYTLIPRSDIQRSAEYDELTNGHPDGESADSSALDYFRLLSTDIGVINASTAQPAPGTRLLDNGQSAEKRCKAEMLLLRSTNADATLSVHLLVGCYQNRAAIEQGSRVRVLRVDGNERTMTSQRSLLSDQKVRAPGHYLPVVGMVEPVKSEAFDREIGELMEPYLEPALSESLGG